LVVELDGPIHDSQVDEDAARGDFLQGPGLHVIRVSNDEVLADITAPERIAAACDGIRLADALQTADSTSPFTQRGPGGEVP